MRFYVIGALLLVTFLGLASCETDDDPPVINLACEATSITNREGKKLKIEPGRLFQLSIHTGGKPVPQGKFTSVEQSGSFEYYFWGVAYPETIWASTMEVEKQTGVKKIG